MFELSDANIGTLIGGGICILSTFLTMCVERWKLKKQQDHEKFMYLSNLIDVPRMNALCDYSAQLGASFHRAPGNEFSQDKYYAAYQRAALYVSPETLMAMQAATPLLFADGRHGSLPPMTPEEKLESVEISTLSACLQREMALLYNDSALNQHARSRRKKNQKKQKSYLYHP